MSKYSIDFGEFISYYGWAIVAFMVIIGGLIAYVYIQQAPVKFGETTFTIYKTECSNETGYCDTITRDYIEINEEIKCSGACDCKYVNFSCKLTDTAYNNLTEEQISEWGLVGKKATFDDSVDYGLIILLVHNGICSGETVIYVKDCFPKIRTAKIYKEELTMDWLDNNCIFNSSLNPGIRYECGEYFVEARK